jgi:ABC-type Fe3+-hydroxamate transport system substrate-binding protein
MCASFPVLKRLRLRVLHANPNRFEKLYAFIRAIGEATGTQREASQLTRSMQARVARVRRQTPKRPPQRLFAD